MKYILVALSALMMTAPTVAFSQSGNPIIDRLAGPHDDRPILERLADNNDIIPSADFQPVKSSSGSNIIVLSHSYNNDVFPEIIGEVRNNDTRSYDKFDVDIVANFRDTSGALVSSEEGFIDAETLGPGDSSAFKVTSLDESLPDKASTYDLIIEDEREVVDAPLEGNNDEDGGEDEDN